MLINDGFFTGLLVKAVSDALILVWAGYNKLYDVIFVAAIFSALNFDKILKLVTN